MTKENIIKLHAHFSKIEKEGINSDNPIREQLVKSDAKRNKEEIEKKHPHLFEKETQEEVKKPKSKDKK